MTTISINSEKEYLEAMDRLNQIFDAAKNTPEGCELESLGRMIDEYEKIHYPMGGVSTFDKR
jgi:HTH-type transcriptional regulator/antitoxin HigA